MSTTIIDTIMNALTNLFNWQTAPQAQQPNPHNDNNNPPPHQQQIPKTHSQPHPLNTISTIATLPTTQTLSLKPQLTTASRNQKAKHKTNSSVISYIKNYLIQQQTQCIICLLKFKKPGVVKFCLCQHETCRICLRQYINSKLKSFVMPKCPEQQCLANIDKQTMFFKTLNQKTRQLFDKVEKFYFISNDPFLKMCPNENCQGIIPVIEGQPYQCLQCQHQFCKQCMYLKHKGKCTKNQALVLNTKYNFTKCDQCGIIVQKTQACDHMTCKCGYQFCYKCGRKWVGAHRCNPPVKRKNSATSAQQSYNCFDYTWKLALTVLLSPLLAVWLVVLVLVLLLGLFVGMFFYSFICVIDSWKKQSPALFLLLVILFPVAMILGVYTAFKQYWGEKVLYIIKMPYQKICQ